MPRPKADTAHTLLQHMIDQALGDYHPMPKGRCDVDRQVAVRELKAERDALRELIDAWDDWAQDEWEWRGYTFADLKDRTRAYLDALTAAPGGATH